MAFPRDIFASRAMSLLLTAALISLSVLLLISLLSIRGTLPTSLSAVHVPRQNTSDGPVQLTTAECKDDSAPEQPLYLHYLRFKPDDKPNVTLKLLDYISIMSAVENLKPDAIMIHGDHEPVGEYWEQARSKNWVQFVYRNKTERLLGKITKVPHLFHMADMVKLEILLDYGGLAADFDIYFVRGERVRTMFKYNRALACFGDDDGYNMGLVGFRKDSVLLRALRHSYDSAYFTQWNYLGDMYKFLTEVFAEEVYVFNHVCNNPHPHVLGDFYRKTTGYHWEDSIATHTYHQHMDMKIVQEPAELYVNASTYKTLMLTILENRTLPPEDISFRDRIDPVAKIPYLQY